MKTKLLKLIIDYGLSVGEFIRVCKRQRVRIKNRKNLEFMEVKLMEWRMKSII